MDERSSSGIESLPEELLQFVKPELSPGERLLWAAFQLPRPPASGPPPFLPIYFAIAFGSLGVGLFYAIFGPLREKLLGVEMLMITVGVIASLIGIISAIMGIGFLAESWWPDGCSRPRVYALTDRRAIVWIPRSDSQAIEVHAVARGSISSLHRLEYPDGSGDVMFRYPSDPHRIGVSGIEGIADVRRVEELVRRTLIDPNSPSQT